MHKYNFTNPRYNETVDDRTAIFHSVSEKIYYQLKSGVVGDYYYTLMKKININGKVKYIPNGETEIESYFDNK